MKSLVSTADAFSIIFQSALPERRDIALKIAATGFDYFRTAGVGASDWGTGQPVELPAEAQVALDALNTLREGIKKQSIKLRGCLDDERAEDIGAIDAKIGDLDPWLGILTVRLQKGERKYHAVHCYADEIEKLIEGRAPQTVPSSPLRPRKAAEQAFAACYPNGLTAEVQNGPLCKTLANWLKANMKDMPPVSNTTLLRVAGRKKEAAAKQAK